MSHFCLIVHCEVQPDRVEEFKTLIMASANFANEHEEGCKDFSVMVDPAKENSFYLYEEYVDKAAFDVHC